MAQSHERASTSEYLLLSAISATISVTALIFYFRHGAILLYGDAVAHSNIARHVFDSRTPGVLEFGTVWLPLPHLLDVPFVVNDWMWRSGLGASIPSMIAYVLGALGICRMDRCPDLRAESEPDLHAGHGDDGGALPGILHLGRGSFFRICSRRLGRPATRGQVAAVLRHHDRWGHAGAL